MKFCVIRAKELPHKRCTCGTRKRCFTDWTC